MCGVSHEFRLIFNLDGIIEYAFRSYGSQNIDKQSWIFKIE